MHFSLCFSFIFHNYFYDKKMVFVKDRPQQYLVQKKIIPNYRLTFNPQIRQRFGAAMGDKTGAFEFPFQCYFCYNYFYDKRMVFVRDVGHSNIYCRKRLLRTTAHDL